MAESAVEPGIELRDASLKRLRRCSAVQLVPMPPLVLIPAYNEAATLAAVVAEVAAERPDLGVLVVDDASTDGTGELLPRLGVAWLELGQHLGVGGALRAGLRWARMHGVDTVVRMDGDGQHGAGSIADLLAPLGTGQVDAQVARRDLKRFYRRYRELGGEGFEPAKDAAAGLERLLQLCGEQKKLPRIQEIDVKILKYLHTCQFAKEKSDLETELKMSRATVDKRLSCLRQLGLIERIRGRGKRQVISSEGERFLKEL